MTDESQPTKKDTGTSSLTIGNIAGEIHNSQIAGGDIRIQKEEEAYAVHGQNPYLGLRSFTYDERSRYAGRESTVAEALKLLTAPGEQRTLLFVTGASGSGKSSFVQAGLLPALEIHYKKQNRTVRRAVFRPLKQPLHGLADAFLELGLPPEGPFAGIDQYMKMEDIPAEPPPASQISLLVIDQFEELFTQSVPDQQDTLFAILESLPVFAELRMHIIVTMRNDYLSELFACKPLYDIAKQGINLRAMNVAELKLAIQQPLQHAFPDADKRFEAELLEKLAEDAAVDATYLPLLQVTLEDLWRRGILKRGAYDKLTDAIQQRADEVYDDTTDISGRTIPRSKTAKEMMLQILLALVEVSLDDKQRRDVRRRRPVQDVTQNSIERGKLIEELADKRLLSTGLEVEHESGQEIATVDIIHESLIVNWSRLREAITAKRVVLQQRTRFEHALAEWQRAERAITTKRVALQQRTRFENILDKWLNTKIAITVKRVALQQRTRFENILDKWLNTKIDDTYLLEGIRLAEAQDLVQMRDVAVQSPSAQAFFKKSIARQEQRQKRQRTIAGSVITALSVLLISALISSRWAIYQAASAVAAQATAEAESVRANQQAERAVAARATAEAESIRANQQTGRAVAAQATAEAESIRANQQTERAVAAASAEAEQRQIAEARRLEAESAQITAEIQSNLARSSGFVAIARAVREGREDPSESLPILLLREAVVLAQKADADAASPSLAALDSILASAPPWRMTLPAARHTGVVHAVAYSPLGDLIASAGADGFVRIWDTKTGDQREILIGHSDEVRSVAWDRKGERLLTASQDGTARVWDVKNGGSIVTVLLHPEKVWSVAWSHDEEQRYVLTTADDNVIRIWDLASNKTIQELEGHTALVFAASWSPDDSKIVSASWDGTARIWSMNESSKYLELGDHSNAIFAASFSNDGQYVVTAGGDHLARIWDVETGEEIRTLSGHSDTIYSASFSPDGTQVVTASQDKIVGVWDWKTRSAPTMHMLSGHEDPVVSASWSPGGGYIASSDLKGVIRIWNVESRQEEQFLQGHQTWVMSATWSRDGTKLLSASADHTARIWDTVTGSQLLTLVGHSKEVWAGAWSPDGTEIVTGSDDGTAIVWDSNSGTMLKQLSMGAGWVRVAKYSPDGRTLAIGDQSGTIYIFDRNTYEEIERLHSGLGWVTSVDWSPQSDYLVASFGCTQPKPCDEQPAMLWDIQDPSQIRILRGHDGIVRSVGWSPASDFIATGGVDGTVRLWDGESGEQLRAMRRPDRPQDVEVWSVSWNPKGTLIAAAYSDGQARIWSAVTGAEVTSLLGHTAPINSITWSPRGEYLVTASEDRTLRIWYADNPQVIRPLTSDAGEVWTADFSPDSSQLALAGLDSAVHIWDIQTGHELQKVGEFSGGAKSVKYDHSGLRLAIATGHPWVNIVYLDSHDAPINLVGHQRGVNDVIWSSQDDRFIATASDDNTARLWDTQTWKTIHIFEGHTASVQQVAFNEDDSLLATASADRSVRIWETTSGNQILQLDGHGDGVMSVAFSHDSTRIATASRDQMVRIWETSTGTLIFTLAASGDDLLSVAWSIDDKYIISAGMNSPNMHTVVQVWDADSHKEIRQLVSHTDDVTYAGWSPDGHWIVTTSIDGSARLWPGTAQDLIDVATKRIQRSPTDFTLVERGRFGIIR